MKPRETAENKSKAIVGIIPGFVLVAEGKIAMRYERSFQTVVPQWTAPPY